MNATSLDGKNILITGASGFIGSFLVERALEKGMKVWAAVRKNSSRRYLQDARIQFIELDFGHAERLQSQISEHCREHGPWDYVIHAAGATKCLRPEDFYRTNTEGTLLLARTLLAEQALTGRFVLISSLSVMGAIREEYATTPTPGWQYAPIKDSDMPAPNTAYGRSKLQAEQGLAEIAGLDYIILRPTGVYGPRERDYFLMAKSIASHVDFAVGYRPQEITFIYVEDLVTAALHALTQGVRGKAYFLTDGGIYHSRTFSDLLQKEMGVGFVLHIKPPLWVLRFVSYLAGHWASATGKASTLNMDKYHIMKQRNWQCDIAPACKELNYQPQFPLERGVQESVAWYKKEKWL